MKSLSDPAFPGLGTALDISAVLEQLDHALPECQGTLELAWGRVVKVLYEPGSQCALLYQVKLRDGSKRGSTRLLLSADLLRVGERSPSLPRELLRRYESSAARTIRTSNVYLPVAQMMLYPFPIDPALPRLFDALDPLAMKREFNRLRLETHTRARRIKLDLLKYMPRARATFLYKVLADAEGGSQPKLQRVIGKAYRRPARRGLVDALSLWQATRDLVRVPRPIAYLPRFRIALQEEVIGQPLSELASSDSFLDLIRESARSLAALHGVSVPLLTRRGPTHEATLVQRSGRVLAAVLPDTADRIERLCSRLAAQVEASTRLTGPVHGDFHPANVLVENGSPTIVDLDELAYGEPLIDVGSFVSWLRSRALRSPDARRPLTDAAEAFLEQYLSACGGGQQRVAVFEAAFAFKWAVSLFANQKPGWEEDSLVLVDEAERLSIAANSTPAALSGREWKQSGQQRRRSDAAGQRRLLHAGHALSSSAEGLRSGS